MHNLNRFRIGAAGKTNVQGEDQKKLDVLSNEIMINALRGSGKVAVLVSEENDDAVFVEEHQSGATFETAKGKYCVVFDPLDGSSNIEAGVNIGTIFGIYLVQDGSKGELSDVLRPGKEMVAAGYCMYGSSANLVLTTGNGVNGYTLDNGIGEFILTHPSIRLPDRGKIYSINEGNSAYYYEPVLKYLESIKYPKGEKKPYSARYIGEYIGTPERRINAEPLLTNFMCPLLARRFHGRRRPPYFAIRRHLRIPRRPEVEEGKAEAALRGLPHGIPHRAGRRHGHNGKATHSRRPAGRHPRALPSLPRLKGRCE